MSSTAPKRRILVVGEGLQTEYNYFVGFRKAFEKELEATATSVTVARGKGGNASNIVQKAINEVKKFKPNRKRGDRVFLLLDTEGAGRAPELSAAENLAKKAGIEIVYSSPAFEYWLLCHFKKIPRTNFKDCAAFIVALNKVWNVCVQDYDKADQEVFVRLSDSFDVARAQALEIDLHHLKTIAAARCTNPSSQVYELIAILIGVKTGEKCPLTGTWILVGDTVTVQLNKGDRVPPHNMVAVCWRL